MPGGGDEISVAVTPCHEQVKKVEVLGWSPVSYEDGAEEGAVLLPGVEVLPPL